MQQWVEFLEAFNVQLCEFNGLQLARTNESRELRDGEEREFCVGVWSLNVIDECGNGLVANDRRSGFQMWSRIEVDAGRYVVIDFDLANPSRFLKVAAQVS